MWKVTIKTPSSIDWSDKGIFPKKDTVNQKPYRIVVDVQKKVWYPKPAYYGKRPSFCTSCEKMPTGSGKYSISGGLSGKQLRLTQVMVVVTLVPLGPHGTREKYYTHRFSM